MVCQEDGARPSPAPVARATRASAPRRRKDIVLATARQQRIALPNNAEVLLVDDGDCELKPRVCCVVRMSHPFDDKLVLSKSSPAGSNQYQDFWREAIKIFPTAVGTCRSAKQCGRQWSPERSHGWGRPAEKEWAGQSPPRPRLPR